MSWMEWAALEAGGIHDRRGWRELNDFDAAGPRGELGGKWVTSFASNDYLGLSQHPEVVSAAHEAIERWGAGSGSARLIVGSRPIHSALENALARWKDAQAALLFSSGYTANLGVLSAFGERGTTILSDERNHASIVDGCRMARANTIVYPHLDLEFLEARLRRKARSIVVSDSVFSMDGDVAPVNDLIELCNVHGALLVLDEAHAVLGPAPAIDPETAVLRVGTLSKFLGAAGGFVAGPRRLIDLLVNRARPFIFTTGGSPADAGAALCALDVLRSDEGRDLVARLRGHVDSFSPGHPSPIVPVILGDEGRALDAARTLLERGFLVPAIRPPSVAPGTARLRVTLSAAHTEKEVGALREAIDEVEKELAEGRLPYPPEGTNHG